MEECEVEGDQRAGIAAGCDAGVDGAGFWGAVCWRSGGGVGDSHIGGILNWGVGEEGSFFFF